MALFSDSWRGGGTGNGGYTLSSRTTSEVPLILQLITGQVANGLEIKNALGSTIFSVSPVGDVTYTGSETVTDAITATGAVTGGSLSISGLSTLSAGAIISGGLTVSSGLSVTGNSTFGDETTIHTLTVQGEIKLESGYIRTKYSANLHLLPSPSTITIVGDATSTSQSLAANDDLLVCGKLEVDGVTYLDGGSVLGDDAYLYFGSSSDAGIAWNTSQTVDGWYFGTATGQNTMIIAEVGDIAYDFAHDAQTNPTLFIHSATQSTTQWMSLTHNQTDSVITTGAGGFQFTQTAGTTGTTGFTFNIGAHTAITAATEQIGINVPAVTKTWDAGAGPLATQREFVVVAPTYAGNAGGALTITDAYTFYVNGVPTAGANMTITRPWALGVSGCIDQSAALVGGRTGFNQAFSTSGTSSLTLTGQSLALNAGYTGAGITQVLSFDNALAGTNTSYLTDTTYGSRLSGNRGAGGYARGVTAGHNVGGLFLAAGGAVNWGSWNASTVALTNKSNIGSIGLGFNDAVGGEGIGVYALYNNPAAVPNIGADTKTAFLADNAANAVDIAIFRDNAVEVLVIEDGGVLTLTPAVQTSGVPYALTLTGAAHTGLTAATEVTGIDFDMSATKTWAAGAGPLNLQREVMFQAPTYNGDAGGALTISNAFTVYINGAPTQGTNITLTNTYGLGVAGGIQVLGTGGNGLDIKHNDTDATYVNSTGSHDFNALLQFSTGQAITAGDYQVGRNADGTNLMQYNVPTGASHEISVNDVAIVTVTSTALGLIAGSAASPSLNFSDTNTGLYSGGADILGFATDGLEVLLVNGTVAASSGDEILFDFSGVVNQSATAGYIGYNFDLTLTALGSGQGRIVAFGTDGNTAFAFDSDSTMLFTTNTASLKIGANTISAYAMQDDVAGGTSSIRLSDGGTVTSGAGLAGGSLLAITGAGSDAFAASGLAGGAAGSWRVVLGAVGVGDGAGANGAGGAFVVGGATSYSHYGSTQQTAPTATLTSTTLNDGGGSGAAIAVTAGSTDAAGSFTVTAGNGTPTAGVAGQVVFNVEYASIPKAIIVTAKDVDGVNNEIYISSVTTTQFQVSFGTTLAASEAVEFFYWAIQ